MRLDVVKNIKKEEIFFDFFEIVYLTLPTGLSALHYLAVADGFTFGVWHRFCFVSFESAVGQIPPCENLKKTLSFRQGWFNCCIKIVIIELNSVNNVRE